jgi:cysteine desulfurase
MDYAATTPTDPRVVAAMEPFWTEQFGNSSSLYERGRFAKEALQNARKKIANIIGARPEEIIFTGSGTESDALALFGVMRSFPGKHFITDPIEHHAVLYNAEKLQKENFPVSYIPVDVEGFVDVKKLAEAITADTVLVSVMYVNNEIGTIEPLEEIGKLVKQERKKRKETGNQTPIWFHTDACQAAGYLDLNVEKLGVDLMTVNGSKIYGPKGTGFLYIRKGVRLQPLWNGGGQESKLRSGTENIAGIVGLAKALELVQENKDKEIIRLTELRDYFIEQIFAKVPKVVLNGSTGGQRLCNNVNVSILDIEGEAMLLYLDSYGIEASTGSACDSATLDPSHVILAIGRPYEFAHASMRFTLGKETTKADINYVLEKLPTTVETLRKISPVNIDMNATQMSSAAAFAGEGLPHWERKRGTKLKKQVSSG